MPRYTQAELNELMETLEAQECARKRIEDDRVTMHLRSGIVPTPEPIARILAWRVGEERHRLMRDHCFWKEWKLRCGFDALVSASLAAHLDLARCEAALTAYAASHDSFEDHIDHTVENPAQKEVMAFCASYAGTVDTLRRIKRTRPELAEEIDRLRLAATNAPEFQFILDLRRNLSHGSVIVPGWSVSTNFVSTSGIMKFSASDLLAFGTWNAVSQGYLEKVADADVAISAVTATCARGLALLRRELKALFFRNRSAAEADYFDLEDLTRRLGGRQSIKIILQGHVEKGTDPYLHWFFAQDVVRQILRYPPHSAEQVEYMITQRAASTDCDDALRSMLYKLFSVRPELEAQREQPGLDLPQLVGRWRTQPLDMDNQPPSYAPLPPLK